MLVDRFIARYLWDVLVLIMKYSKRMVSYDEDFLSVFSGVLGTAESGTFCLPMLGCTSYLQSTVSCYLCQISI